MTEGNPDPHEGALPGAGLTLWTLVVGAARKDGPEALSALNVLAEQYRMPLYVYIRRRLGNEEDAQDVVQAFFERILQPGSLLDRAERDKGSFRWFLRRALDCFLIDEWRKAGAAKRGGRAEHLPLSSEEEMYESLGAEALTEGDAYEAAWALQISLLAMERLGLEAKEPWMPPVLEYLSSGAPRKGQAALAAQMGVSAECVRTRLHRVRAERLPALMRAALADQCDGSPREMQESWEVLCAHIPGLRSATGT
jgi:RNA polymerase sigma factor (sigma-70 family)